MIPENLQNIERDFRRAVVRQDYHDLKHRSSALKAMLRESLVSLPPNDPSRREVIAWGIALTDWGCKMICTQRQRWANEKQPLAAIGRYFRRPSSRAAHVCIDL